MKKPPLTIAQMRTANAKIAANNPDTKSTIHCPKCGFQFSHGTTQKGKAFGGVGGAATGAALGARIGIVGGPIGAMAGTIPGAILGAIFGAKTGGYFDKPTCPECGTTFATP